MLKTYPPVTVVRVQAAPPSLQDNTADLDRLRAALTESLPQHISTLPVRIPFECMTEMAAGFRNADFTGYALIHILEGRIEAVHFFPEKPEMLPALALDLGSTHLEATLLDLLTGATLARGNALNRQVRYGEDILSRIHFAGQKEGLAVLQKAAVDSINGLIEALSKEAGVHPAEIHAVAVSGNTTMIHLLLGINPYHICREPYIPLVNAPDPFPAWKIGLKTHCRAVVRVLPGRGSYFGGDLIAGILATGLDQTEEISMLIDVGTNAEVVMGNSGWLIACAGAAGPALEGGVAKMGMRAAAGAVDHVVIDQDDQDNWQLRWRTIGDAPPLGICGSGLIDLVAELYLARVIDLRGKFQTEFPGQSEAHSRFVRERLLEMNGELAFIVVATEEAGNDAPDVPIMLTQIDLDAMMRSKAAMYAILVTLTGQVGIEFSELKHIYVAGAFGKHIDPHQAITLGMLPDLPVSVFQPVGNSSLRGAEMILLDHTAYARAQEIAQKITYVELNVNQDFMIRFSGSRFIPHTDPSLFPSVPNFR
ncbi:MAG: ASKHA domain-containing protein [Candidatus Electrothrix sp. YB6]